MRRPNAAMRFCDHAPRCAPSPRAGSTARRRAGRRPRRGRRSSRRSRASSASRRFGTPASTVPWKAKRSSPKAAGQHGGRRARGRGRSGSPSTSRAAARRRAPTGRSPRAAARPRTPPASPRPAASKYADQSRPGASESNWARVQWLLPFFTSTSSSRVPCASAMRRSRSTIRAAFAGGVRHARQLEHARDVGLELRADLRHARRGVEVVLAVGHVEPALEQEGRVAGRVVEVLGDPQAEQVVGVEVRGVEHVHVGAQRLAERARERARSAIAAMRSSRGWSGARPLRVDRRLVDEARVVVADALRRRALRRAGLRRLLDDLGRPLRGQLGRRSRPGP